ncbi:MAG: class I SAM-dependent methyltransferase [Spirochaetia bacterium]|nr:class I SAM-dependent methyltransferase [Spirochaetia bacterium]
MDYFNKYKSYMESFANLLNPQKIQLLNLYFESLISNAMPKGFIGEGKEEENWLRHIFDSILVLQENDVVRLFMESDVVVDLGAGAGLPGIPLSILFPETEFVLVEAMEKRAKYIKEIIHQLNIGNVCVVNKRIEDIQSNDVTGNRRLILFRAFLKPLVSLEMALRVIPANDKKLNEANKTESSKVLYWRSRRFDISNESLEISKSQIQQIHLTMIEMGYDIKNYYSLKCPVEMNSRGVYLIEYQGKSNIKYPRSWARIKKDVFINGIN